jgi:hypothetical protein
VVLGEMVAVEPGAVIGLDQLQPLLEEWPMGTPLSSKWSKIPKRISCLSSPRGLSRFDRQSPILA